MSSLKRRQTLVDISPNKMGSTGKKAREYKSPNKVCTAIDFEKENYNYLFDDNDSFMFTSNFEADNEASIEDVAKQANALKGTLNLESWQRCKVDGIERDKNFDLILQLSNENNKEEKTKCRLQGVWSNTKVEAGDVVSVIAVWNQCLQSYVVTNNDGTIVANPDHLISGTSVVGSLFCQRKVALQERFRGIDTDSKIMVVGSVTHELFQTVLFRKLKTHFEVEQACKEILQSENVMYMLYANKMSTEEMRSELNPFISNIVDFVERYIVGSKRTESSDGQFAGIIESIQDIEENVWVPRLGLKGKIDVSLRVKADNKLFHKEHKYMPLELKTGRASFSNEHKGQLFLYEMMLHEIGRQVDSGLLLYLREGIMKEIQPTNNSKRDIIILRNELSYYLTRNIDIKESEQLNELLIKYKSLILPEPINNTRFCPNCPYNTICSIYLQQDDPKELSSNLTMQKVASECMNHLNSVDIEYFTHWCGLLTLEDQEFKRGNNVKSLWTRTAEERRDEGHAIINLKIVGDIKVVENKFLHSFETVGDHIQSTNFDDFTLTGINPGDYVILSIRKRVAIATGHVYYINKNRISVHLERNLLQNYPNEKFIIDKHTSQSTNVFNYTNLGVLLEDRDESNKLRRIVVDKLKPTFMKEQLSVPKAAQEILLKLNSEQRQAVAKALKMNDYMLLKGLPGTGKTQTLVALINLLNLMRKSIIITSHTHSAVDNVLLRLKQLNSKFLRLGSDARIDPALHDCSETQLSAACKTPDDLAKFYSSFNIIGVTCHGASHSIFLHRRFDICIVDEATQVFQPTILRPLFYADKFLLVGDPDQLPPVVKSKLARKIGASESLFHRLDDPESTATLSTQYRMNKTVTKLANGLTYGGNLLCANESVSSRTIDLPNKTEMFEKFRKHKWLLRALEKHVDLSVVVLDTKDCLQRSLEFERSMSIGLSQVIEKTFSEDLGSPQKTKFTYTNYCDAAIAFFIVKSLIVGGCPATNIGIIAPYRAQVELLRKIYDDCLTYYSSSTNLGSASKHINFEGLEVNTVDQYQGRDKEIIIYSCTRTGCSNSDTKRSGRAVEILEDQRRLTVAITRSKCKLIIIGDAECLKGYTPFMILLEKIPSRCQIILEDETMGFSWNEILSDLKKVLSI